MAISAYVTLNRPRWSIESLWLLVVAVLAFVDFELSRRTGSKSGYYYTILLSRAFDISLIAVALLAYADFHRPCGQEAFADFHQPYSQEQVRLATTRRRYILGATIYVLGAIFLFVLSVSLISRLIVPLFQGEQCDPECAWRNGVPVVSAGTLALFTALPELPFLRRKWDRIRSHALRVAYFPAALDEMLALMRQVKFAGREKAHESVAAELSAYGVSADDSASVYLGRPLAMAVEIESIRLFLQTLDTDSEFANIGVKIAKLFGATLTDLELQRGGLFSRLAQAFAVMKALQPSASSSEETRRSAMRAARSLVAILEDSASSVLESYRQIVAQVSLSQIGNPEKRSKFLQKIGYGVPKQLEMPFWPFVLSFIIIFGGMLTPLAFARQRTLLQIQRAVQPEDLASVVLIIASTAQAVIQSLSLAWAILPKTYSNFARPSLDRLPTRSYVVYAVYSFTTSVVLLRVMLEAFPFMPFAQHMPWTYLIQSLIPMCYTIVTAVCIDRHLRRSEPIELRDRMTDGVVFCVVIGAVQIFVSALLLNVLHLVGADGPPVDSGIVAEYIVAVAAVSFLIGFVVPATAAEVINRNSPIRPASLFEGDPVRQSVGRAVASVRLGVERVRQKLGGAP